MGPSEDAELTQRLDKFGEAVAGFTETYVNHRVQSRLLDVAHRGKIANAGMRELADRWGIDSADIPVLRCYIAGHSRSDIAYSLNLTDLQVARAMGRVARITGDIVVQAPNLGVDFDRRSSAPATDHEIDH